MPGNNQQNHAPPRHPRLLAADVAEEIGLVSSVPGAAQTLARARSLTPGYTLSLLRSWPIPLQGLNLHNKRCVKQFPVRNLIKTVFAQHQNLRFASGIRGNVDDLRCFADPVANHIGGGVWLTFDQRKQVRVTNCLAATESYGERGRAIVRVKPVACIR